MQFIKPVPEGPWRLSIPEIRDWPFKRKPIVKASYKEIFKKVAKNAFKTDVCPKILAKYISSKWLS